MIIRIINYITLYLYVYSCCEVRFFNWLESWYIGLKTSFLVILNMDEVIIFYLWRIFLICRYFYIYTVHVHVL